MAQHIILNSVAGYGFSESAAQTTAEARAMSALWAGGVRGMVWPTGGASGFAVSDGAEVYVQDAIFPATEYRPNALSGAPVIGAGAAPSLSWAGVSGARGMRAVDAMAAGINQFPVGGAGANPDFWMMSVATLGPDDASQQVIAGVNVASATTFGDAMLVTPTNIMQMRLGNNALNWSSAAVAARSVPHIFGARYIGATDQMRLYYDGALNSTYTVASSYPGWAMTGGAIYFGGRMPNNSIEQLDAPGSALHAVIAGSGQMTDEQWSDVHAWLKGVFGIP